MLKLVDYFQISEENLNSNGKLPIEKILHIFQDAAGDHATGLGKGMEELIADGMTWILTKVRFEVCSELAAGKYRIETFPLKRKGATFPRDYYIYDSRDNQVIRGTSQWCIVDFKSRKILRNPFDFDGIFTDAKAFEDGIPKIMSADVKPAGEHVITKKDMDMNMHTNNCRYGGMVEEVIGERDYRELVINFSKETVEGDVIRFFSGEIDGICHVEGHRGDDIIFKANVR